MVRKPAGDLITEYEYAYLIERVHEGSPVWMRHDATWTSDATEARRFVSQEEAGRVIAATRSEARVVEHGFSARPVMPDRPADRAPSEETAYERGSIVSLRGKTLRGKNRISRGGRFWIVVATNPKWGVFLESCAAGSRECFWATLPRDQHVEEAP